MNDQRNRVPTPCEAKTRIAEIQRQGQYLSEMLLKRSLHWLEVERQAAIQQDQHRAACQTCQGSGVPV